MTPDLQSKKRAIAYSFLAHAHNLGTFAKGPLDIFIPIVQHALFELYPEGSAKGANVSELADAIEERFNLEFPIPVLKLIMGIIAKNVNSKSGVDDIVLYNDGAFDIKKFSFECYKEQLQKSEQEVSSVVGMFQKFCSIYDIAGKASENDLLRFIEQNRAEVSFYLSHEIKELDKQSVIAAQFVDYFRQVPGVYDILRNLYLGSMLTNYLSYQPTEVKLDIELLLDTNFIVSLLDLNTVESTKTCNTLVNMCKRLGYKFTVLKDTTEEFQGLLNHKAENLGSAIIARTINKEDIYNACDRRHLTKVDLERIADNIEDTLSTKYGIYVVPHTEKWSKKAKFSPEYGVLKKIRNTDKAALHDAIAIAYVQEKRAGKKITKFEDVCCWFVNNAISHSGELDEDVECYLGNTSSQPEIIKADDLLNIIWITSPSLVQEKDIIDLGLASMVSYTINTSLPKARIIKELDENIQKYSSSNEITDKDVLRLATRIAHRQIADVQALNEIAKRDNGEFAKRVKEEADKQREVEAENAKKLQDLMDSVSNLIDSLQQNKENQDIIYKTRMASVEANENKLNEKLVELSKQDAALEQKKKAFEAKEDAHIAQLQNLWKRERIHRKEQREEYLQFQVDKEKQSSKKRFIRFIILWSIFIVLWVIGALFFIPNELSVPKLGTIRIKLITIILSSLISLIMLLFNIFVIRDLYNWCRNPSYEKNKRDLLSQKLPKHLEDISFEDFISNKE